MVPAPLMAPPLIVAPFRVNAASTMTLPPELLTVDPEPMASAPESTSMVPALVTVSPFSALPVPLTLRVPLFFRMPLLSTALPVRSSSPLFVTVPTPVTPVITRVATIRRSPP